MLGRILLSSIEARHDVRLKQPIRADKTEATSRLRRRIEVVLPWETEAGHRAGDRPARWKGNLADLSPKPIKVSEAANHHALALPDLPKLWQVPDTREGMAARALQSEVHYP